MELDKLTLKTLSAICDLSGVIDDITDQDGVFINSGSQGDVLTFIHNFVELGRGIGFVLVNDQRLFSVPTLACQNDTIHANNDATGIDSTEIVGSCNRGIPIDRRGLARYVKSHWITQVSPSGITNHHILELNITNWRAN